MLLVCGDDEARCPDSPLTEKVLSRSYSASVSRAMRRLEQRGLIVRFNWISNGYTDNQHPNGYQMRTTHILA